LLTLYGAFLQRKGGAAALARALDGKKLTPDVARLGIRAVRSSVQDAPELIAALQKAGDLAAQKREMTKSELEQIVADVQKFGNASKGEMLYRRADMQCLKCHAIGGAGGQVGPDLVSIGASAPVDYLIESLLIPNKAVKEGFHALRVETLDGKVHIGVKLRESKTEIVLRNAEDKEIVIPANDVDTKRESRSLMPDGLVDTLTRDELIDLTRFLSELGKVGPYSLTKARVVRRWQALQNTPQAGNLIRRSRIAAAAENDPAFVWNSIYAKVSGDLPLEGLPTLTIWQDTAPLIVVRALFDVTAAGKVKVKLNSATGISLLVGANPVEVKDETIVELPQGQQVLLFAIDTTKRKEPLRCELEDVEGSPARVSVLGGK
jgi:putative heme-binding domain-containing protein